MGYLREGLPFKGKRSLVVEVVHKTSKDFF